MQAMDSLRSEAIQFLPAGRNSAQKKEQARNNLSFFILFNLAL
jgi:hypothetical protein